MHFKENEQVREDLEKIDDHFSTISRRSLTTEQLLGFKREVPNFVINWNFISELKNDLTSLVIVKDKIDEIIKDPYSIQQINLLSDSIKKPYFQLDDTNGVIDKRYVNGQMSIYKEWVDFAEQHGVSSSLDFNELKQGLTESAIFFKKAGMVVKDLSKTVKEINNNKRNTRYIQGLVDDFKEVYNEKIEYADSFFMSINEEVSKYESILYKMTIDIETLKDQVKEKSPEVMLTMAHKFCNSQSTNVTDISNFLKSKDFDDLIEARVQLKGQSKPDNILFKDGSYACADKGEYFHTISPIFYYNQLHDLHDSVIGHLSRKKPKIASFFKNFIADEKIVDLIPVLDTYQQYSDVINRAGLNIFEMSNKSMEVVDDRFNAIILEHKTNQYVGSILSNKYEHLLSDEARDMFKILYETGVTKQSLQDYIGKKIAALKTPEEFLEYVTRVKDHFSGFSEDALSVKLEGNGIVPCYNKDGIIIFNVESFDISKKLGSASWCISRDDYYFNGYTDQGSRQYFMYDFNKKETDNTSMIGFTLKQNGTVRASHLKNDDDFKFLDKYSELHLEVLKNDFKEFKLNEEYSKVMKEKYNLEKDSGKNKKNVKTIGQKI